MDTNAIAILTYSCIDMSQKGNSDENYALAKSYIIKIEIKKIIGGKTYKFFPPRRTIIESIKIKIKKPVAGEVNRIKLKKKWKQLGVFH